MARFALRLLLLALGLTFGAAALYLILPAARREQDRDELLRDKDVCQVLIIGPSYVNRLVPSAFDDEAKRIGFPKRACKLGRVNLRGYDLKRELEVVLDHGFPKLELVAIDITLRESLGFDAENWLKPRVIAWHTFGAIPWLARYYSAANRQLEPRTALAHAAHVAAHYTSLGRARELLSDGPEPVKPEPTQRARPTDTKVQKNRPTNHDDKVARLVEDKRAVREKRQTLPSRWGEELRALTRRHGVDAFVFYSPVWGAVKPPGTSKKERDALVFIDFNDAERYPELYTPEVRGTTDHLNPAGATIHARLLAREIQKRWAKRWLKRQ